MTAFVSGYQHDVFVSYAHVDDELLPGEKHPWVSYFIDKLGKGLAMKLGRRENVELWSDHKLGGNMPITPTIVSALEQTATIVILLSPGYVASEWCRREKETFLQLLQTRTRSSADSEVFVVELDELERDERPEALRELIGYKFWIRESLATAAHRMHDGGPPQEVHAYATSFNDLVHALTRKLKAMATAASEKGSPGLAAPALALGKPPIFLAETDHSLRAVRDDVRRFLDQSQIPVLPAIKYPVSPERFQEALDADLQKCELFVQLLGDEPPDQWGAPDLPCGYAGLQYERALEWEKRILQWRDGTQRPIGEIPHAEYRAFLETLERKATLSIGALEEFKKHVLGEYERPAIVPKQRPDSPVVFVDCDRSDDPLALELEKIVLEHNLVCIRCPRRGDPREVDEELSTSIDECEGSIVVFGDITPPWVARQLRQFRKIRGDRPLGETLAVYVGPPPESPGDPNKLEQINYKLPGMRIFDGRYGLAHDDLKAFLSEVAQRTGR